jgi:tetratricopeptide (TPR) repeat protein
VTKPSRGSVAVELLDLLREEQSALGEPELKAALLVRTAFLSWDLEGDEPAAEAALAEAGTAHPLAPRARYDLALSRADGGALKQCLDDALARLTTTSDAAALASVAEIGEALLYRCGAVEDAALAAQAVSTHLAQANQNRSIRDFAALALATAGDHARAYALLSAAAPEDVPAHVEAAVIASDRLADIAGALRELRIAQQHAPTGSPLLAYVIERLIELSEPTDSIAVDALRAKLDLLRTDPRAGSEKAATACLLGHRLEERGAFDEADRIFSELAGAEEGAGLGLRIALDGRRRLAGRRGDAEEAAECLHELIACGGHPSFIRARQRRLAEVTGSRDTGRRGREAEETFAELYRFDPDDDSLVRTLERMYLAAGKAADHLSLLEQAAHGQSPTRAGLLRRASALAEARCRDLETALRLWREAMGDGRDPVELAGFARLLREMHDRTALAQTYRKMADGHLPSASIYLALAGVLFLAVGLHKEAEEALKDAARLDAADVLARAALVCLHRKTGQARPLADALSALIPQLRSVRARGQALRELARVLVEDLRDPQAARKCLEEALSLSPDDPGPLVALSDVCIASGDNPRAIELRSRAADRTDGDADAARLWIEVGGLWARAGDLAREAEAYERASQRDATSLAALEALAGVYRRQGRGSDLVEVVRRQATLEEDPGRRVALHLEAARHLEEKQEGRAMAIEAYRATLVSDPANSVALGGLERTCRADGRWDVLATALRAAPASASNLKLLAEALEHLGDWPRVAEVRLRELELLTDPSSIARASITLAELYERIGDPDAATRLFHRALVADPVDPVAPRAFAAFCERASRTTDLRAALDEQLRRETERETRLALSVRLGELCRGPLAALQDAAGYFEAALAIEPTNPMALTALQELYEHLGREDQLLRIVGLQAHASDEPAARAERRLRLGEMQERRGELDAAFGEYRKAFDDHPANRAAFTSLERMCFKLERWSDALSLYDSAIRLVETTNPRAYRIGDLYSRRGQLLFQYLSRPADAATAYRKVLELDPGDDATLKLVEGLYAQSSDWAALIKIYEARAVALLEDDRKVETLRRAARVAAAKLRDLQNAAAFYGRILEIDPADGEALDALERFHERNKDWPHLAEVLTTRLALTSGGDEAIALHLRIASICEEGLHDGGRAVEHFRKILEIAPGHKEALEHLGRIYEATERWPEFIDVTRRQIRITADRNLKALLYFKCGSVMEAKFAKDDDAIRYYDAAIKTSPSCLPAVHGMRDLYLRRKDFPAVIRTLELEVKLWQDEKERAGVLARIGSLYLGELGDAARAIRYFESALKVDPESLPANRALFELYFSRGEFAAAAPIGQRLSAKAMREGDPEERSSFYVKRAIVARETGDPRSAAESLVIALEIRAENLAALDALISLYRTQPTAYDFDTTFRELEKIYRRREHPAGLAWVLVATGASREQGCDLDGAEQAYREAIALAPEDLAIADALIELKVRERRFTDALVLLDGQLSRQPPTATEARVRILLRQAQILDEGLMDPAKAIVALKELLRIQPANRKGLYQLAQSMFLLGRFDEAYRVCDQLIQLAAAPGNTAPPEELARYYYYLGRIAEANGDAKGAALSYRRAAEWDEAYAPPALALARRAASQGDAQAAHNLLLRAAEAAGARGAQSEALGLYRGIAAIQQRDGDIAGAVTTYRSIVDSAPDSADDRVALAELCARNPATIPDALAQLHESLRRDLRHGPTLRLLGVVHDRSGEHERTYRALTILETLGYASDQDRAQLATLRKARPGTRHGVLSEGARTHLVPPDLRSPITDLFVAVRAEIAVLYSVPAPGHDRLPASAAASDVLNAVATEMVREIGIEADIQVGQGVPGVAAAYEAPAPTVVLDQAALGLSEAELRFLLARALEPLRGGYALALRLGQREREEVSALLRQLVRPEADREASAAEFARALPRKVLRSLDRFIGTSIPPEGPAAWFAAAQTAADRAGLSGCDDVNAALRVLSWLGGQESVAIDGAIALGAVPGGAELVRYYLGDDYHQLRTTLGDLGGKRQPW